MHSEILSQLQKNHIGERITQGNSMEPYFIKGDKVTITALTDNMQLEVGDIVYCLVPQAHTKKGLFPRNYCHLISDIDVSAGESQDMTRYMISNAHGYLNGVTTRPNIYGKVTQIKMPLESERQDLATQLAAINTGIGQICAQKKLPNNNVLIYTDYAPNIEEPDRLLRATLRLDDGTTRLGVTQPREMRKAGHQHEPAVLTITNQELVLQNLTGKNFGEHAQKVLDIIHHADRLMTKPLRQDEA